MGNEVKARILAVLERLRNEHRELDAQIVAIEGMRYQTVAEQQEVRQLKRLKLLKKDEIALLVATSSRRL